MSRRSNNQEQKEEADKVDEVKNRISRQYPDISNHDLEFILSIPREQKITKVTELETSYY